MIRISRRAQSLGTENAFVVLAEVTALARQGKDIISFCIGQPDFPAPLHVQEAGIRAIREGKHGYTPSAGIDPLREPLLTYPVLHYQNGGLMIDEHAETTLAGIYACGEIAGGTHGRNRMMGNSLLECVVFGRRAGRAAAGN